LKFDVTQNASKISSYSSLKNKSPHTNFFLEHYSIDDEIILNATFLKCGNIIVLERIASSVQAWLRWAEEAA
jgi:hypothetical protein